MPIGNGAHGDAGILACIHNNRNFMVGVFADKLGANGQPIAMLQPRGTIFARLRTPSLPEARHVNVPNRIVSNRSQRHFRSAALETTAASSGYRRRVSAEPSEPRPGNQGARQCTLPWRESGGSNRNAVPRWRPKQPIPSS